MSWKEGAMYVVLGIIIGLAVVKATPYMMIAMP